MTPEREKYLANCGKRERVLRAHIDLYKKAIKNCKAELLESIVTNSFNLIPGYKIQLSAYRHELNRLKGMDRVVVPRKAYIGFYGDKGGLCKCEKHITDVHKYCPKCGRKILWEKVK